MHDLERENQRLRLENIRLKQKVPVGEADNGLGFEALDASAARRILKESRRHEVNGLLKQFLNDPKATEISIPCTDNFDRHIVHDCALNMNMVSESRGEGRDRKAVVWKGPEYENFVKQTRSIFQSFALDSSKDKLELPPSASEFRYAARLLARDYALVGISEGLGSGRHVVVWKTPDRKSIDEQLRKFLESDQERLDFPPMDGNMRYFTAVTAADLGLKPISEGVGPNRHPVVYKKSQSWESSSMEEKNLRALFDAMDTKKDGRLSADEVRAAMQAIRVPEHYGQSLIEISSKQCLTFEVFRDYVMSKERHLRQVFNAFDHQHKGFLAFDDIEKVMKSLNLHPSASDTKLLNALKVSAEKAASGALSGQSGREPGMTYNEFRDFFSLINPTDYSRLGEDVMFVGSMGYIGSSARPTPTSAQSPKVQQEHGVIWGFLDANAVSISGAIANAFSRTCVSPMERIRLQMSVDGGKYKNSLDCFRQIYAQEGIKGFWRGNWLNVIRIAPQGAIAFASKDFFSNAIGPQYGSFGLACASMLSGATCMQAVYPLDMIRGRITVTPNAYSHWTTGLKEIYKNEGGLYGWFKGSMHANAWAIVYYGVQFYVYDSLKNLYATVGLKEGEKNRKAGPMTGLAFGAISGSACVSAAYPLELVRRKLQVQGLGGRPIIYKGFADCVQQVYAKEGGVRGFFKGLPANMLKTPPSVAIVFATYEYLMRDVFHKTK
jgi:solute carrier family 25 phosphate transporter 23/24/25/41